MLKLALIDYNTLVSSDALTYYYYAVELYFHDKLPNDSYPLHNLGYPIILASIYKLIPFFDELLFQNIQKVFTVVISTMTVPLVYLLCRKFFDVKYAIFGAFIFAFEPRLVQNSTFGITDPLFIFLSVGAFVLFYSRFIPISFVFVGLAAVTRFEGIILYPLLIALLYLRKDNQKRLMMYSLIFTVPIFAIFLVSDSNGYENGFANKINKEIAAMQGFLDHGVDMNGNIKSFPEMIVNSFVYYFWSSFPMFFFFLPLGVFIAWKEKRELILILFFVSVSGFVAYLDAYDTRYFFPAYPFFTLLTLYSVRKLYSGISLKYKISVKQT